MFHVVFIEAVFDLHLSLKFDLLLFGDFISRINQEALLTRSCLLLVIFRDRINIYVQTHKANERLLSEKSLSLEITLLNVFAWKYT